jgi:MFS family permease
LLFRTFSSVFQALAPLSVDVLFTVGILIISDVFPARTQALAGAVFNTVAQLGTSTGLCTLQVISSVVTEESQFHRKTSPEALMEGYKASFWTTFAFGVTACFIGAFGLRRLGKVGQKRD